MLKWILADNDWLNEYRNARSRGKSQRFARRTLDEQVAYAERHGFRVDREFIERAVGDFETEVASASNEPVVPTDIGGDRERREAERVGELRRARAVQEQRMTASGVRVGTVDHPISEAEATVVRR